MPPPRGVENGNKDTAQNIARVSNFGKIEPANEQIGGSVDRGERTGDWELIRVATELGTFLSLWELKRVDSDTTTCRCCWPGLWRLYSCPLSSLIPSSCSRLFGKQATLLSL